MFCSKCGTTLPDNSELCFNCGAPVPNEDKTDVEPVPQPIAVQPEVAPVVNTPVVEKKKSKTPLIMGIIAGIVVLVGLAVGAYFIFFDDTATVTSETKFDDKKEEEIVCSHEWTEATCTEVKKCSLCDEEDGTELGHTTTQGKCSRCGEYIGNKTWILGNFKDEFGQETNEKYIATMVEGTFSNSATTNSELLAALQVTEDQMGIMLWEYGSHMVKCSYGSDEYSIVMLDTTGDKHYLNGIIYEGENRISLGYSDRNIILKELKKPGEISFYIVYDEYTTSNYLFTIETTNFTELYSQL